VVDGTGAAGSTRVRGGAVAVVGSLNLDHTVRVARLARPGESLVGDLVSTAPGGKGANQAVAAARLGARAALIGCLGTDAAGDVLWQALTAEPRLDVAGVTRVHGPTGTAFVTIDDAGANTVVSARGANASLDEAHVHRHGRSIADADVVLLTLGVPEDAVRAAVEIARSVDTLVVLDPAPADEVPDDVLRCDDVCTPNETEIERLTGLAAGDDAGVRRAADALLARGCGAVVVTLGARGAHLVTADGRARRYAPVPVSVVDPTGAGDACAGALAAALARGLAIEDAVADAVVAGALATTRLGALMAMPTRAELDACGGRPG